MPSFLQQLSTAVIIAAFVFLVLGFLLTDIVWITMSGIYGLVALVIVTVHVIAAPPTHTIYEDV